jgi:hypothetical protein
MADRSEPGSARAPSGAALVVADAAALLAFVAVGLRSHRIGAIPEVAARNLVPLAASWALVSLAVGTYRRRDLVAVPLALLARTWWVGSPRGARIAVFLAVGLVFTLVFLAIGRTVAAAITRTRPVWRAPLSTDRREGAGEPGHAPPRSRGSG